MTNSNNSKSLANLQTALSMELAAIQHYLLHAHVLADWGLHRLAEKMRAEMTEELGHAGRFMERILYLEAMPKVQAAKDAAKDSDLGTRRLFEDIAIEEEGHVDWLTRQIALLAKLGEPTYMLGQMKDTQAA